MQDIHKLLGQLAGFAIKSGLTPEEDIIYSLNQAAEVLGLDSFLSEVDLDTPADSPVPLLEKILDWAAANGKIESDSPVYRDLFDAKLMNTFTPRPSEVNRKFRALHATLASEATDWFYAFSQNTNYIRVDRVAKNKVWKSDTEYGELDITINLSKPEKDPKAIAAARNLPASSYPKCLLCKENEGYAGRVNHPGRNNHRIIPLVLNQEEWFFQYSPYVYYNEHCIVLKGTHEPMKIGRETFIRLLDFVQQYPHYFIGSNADLPIVGGSILSHDHFQGGRYTFAMETAQIRETFELKQFKNVKAGIVNWPMSVLRISSTSKEELIEAADHIFETWKAYSDPECEIHAYSGDERHNTITPIARMRGGAYEMDLVLRNNRTSDEHPMGIFHPHDDVHHIKKENIGLIEVMGLAVLPARLIEELEALAAHWMGQSIETDISIHMDWLHAIKSKYAPSTKEEALEILEHETGLKFKRVLEDAGVYKTDEAGILGIRRFVQTL